MSPDGALIMLDKFGRVLEAAAAPDGGFHLQGTPVAHLGPGRPLGAEVDGRGDLLICDALKGLIKLRRSRGPGEPAVELLTSRVSDDSPMDPGTAIVYANDLDVASNGGCLKAIRRMSGCIKN